MPPLLPAPPHPNTLQDDPHGADAARQRFAPKKGLSRLLSVSSKLNLAWSVKKKQLLTTGDHDIRDDLLHVHSDVPISLESAALISPEDFVCQDRYQWAVLYENQRGITAFSIPYYSSLSLLPTDPAPFTLPDPSLEPAHHPPVSPTTYPLPDGDWHWVSRSWMIDMRSDTGQVQHDGFEYNWIFRRHHWKSRIGPMNIAGYVRRRRWIRLMVRPSHLKVVNGSPISSPSTSSHLGLSPLPKRAYRHSLTSSIQPSLMTGISAHSSIYGHIDPNDVWSGTNSDENWDRCRRLMKHFGRDGRNLELWSLWMGFHLPELGDIQLSAKEKGKRKQWTEDDEPMISETEASAKTLLTKDTVSIAPRECVIPVLKRYAPHILRLFIFPESRVQFLTLLSRAGLLLHLNCLDSGMTEIDFWSYASGLADLPGSEEVILKSPLLQEVFCKPKGVDDEKKN